METLLLTFVAVIAALPGTIGAYAALTHARHATRIDQHSRADAERLRAAVARAVARMTVAHDRLPCARPNGLS